jgi:hypothetical protein
VIRRAYVLRRVKGLFSQMSEDTAGALFVAVLPTLPALDPRLIVVVWLGLSAYIVVGSRRHLLSDHWLTLIPRVGRLWPYSHFAARGL